MAVHVMLRIGTALGALALGGVVLAGCSSASDGSGSSSAPGGAGSSAAANASSGSANGATGGSGAKTTTPITAPNPGGASGYAASPYTRSTVATPQPAGSVPEPAGQYGKCAAGQHLNSAGLCG